MKNTINTYNKHIFNPLHITTNDIDEIDIAHALSLLCRGCGHLQFFYSVGQHCINCANEAIARGYNKHICLACLLHDASEAYVSDLVRPVKIQIPEYSIIEERIINTIYQKFNLNLAPEELSIIKQIDDDMLLYELPVILQVETTPNPMASTPDLKVHEFKEVEKEYLRILHNLM